ncbi:hypothetical protein A4A49_62989, partial [Nicotiana attenuata]
LWRGYANEFLYPRISQILILPTTHQMWHLQFRPLLLLLTLMRFMHWVLMMTVILQPRIVSLFCIDFIVGACGCFVLNDTVICIILYILDHVGC